jgi:hypothetical protein
MITNNTTIRESDNKHVQICFDEDIPLIKRKKTETKSSSSKTSNAVAVKSVKKPVAQTRKTPPQSTDTEDNDTSSASDDDDDYHARVKRSKTSSKYPAPVTRLKASNCEDVSKNIEAPKPPLFPESETKKFAATKASCRQAEGVKSKVTKASCIEGEGKKMVPAKRKQSCVESRSSTDPTAERWNSFVEICSRNGPHMQTQRPCFKVCTGTDPEAKRAKSYIAETKSPHKDLIPKALHAEEAVMKDAKQDREPRYPRDHMVEAKDHVPKYPQDVIIYVKHDHAPKFPGNSMLHSEHDHNYGSQYSDSEMTDEEDDFSPSIADQNLSIEDQNLSIEDQNLSLEEDPMERYALVDVTRHTHENEAEHASMMLRQETDRLTFHSLDRAKAGYTRMDEHEHLYEVHTAEALVHEDDEHYHMPAVRADHYDVPAARIEHYDVPAIRTEHIGIFGEHDAPNFCGRLPWVRKVSS